MRTGKIRMHYGGPFAEYSFYRKGPWEATIPLQVCWGKSSIVWSDGDTRRRGLTGAILVYEPAMTIEYKVLGLIGVGGGIGYRLMLMNNREISQQFTSPLYLIRLRFITDAVIARLKSRQTG